MPAASDSHNRVLKNTKRSHTGCITCRARKVKCDERPTACLNCDRIGVTCAGYSLVPLSRSIRTRLRVGDEAGNGMTEAGIRRRRLHRSCKTCRLAKVKCSGETPLCARCRGRAEDCNYDSTQQFQGNQTAAKFTTSTYIRPGDAEATFSRNHGSSDAHATSLPILAQSQKLKSPHPQTLSSNSGTSRIPAQTDDVDRLHSLNWLTIPQLPNKERIYELVEAYFANIHPLRCFNFIHKPSFMERLDCSTTLDRNDDTLLYMVCSLGAKFYMANALEGTPILRVLPAGNAWAQEAQRLLSNELGHVSIENLMATVLLYDHQLRIGNYAGAFMLSGTTARMAQALQINLEYSADVLCTDPAGPVTANGKESRRRLMWSCYIIDSWVGSGVDQLTLLDECDIKIQLPCIERNFLQKVPCVTETITEGQVLKFLPGGLSTSNAADNLGMTAYFIRLAEIRKKVLRYVKGVDIRQTSQVPEAEFTRLEKAFKDWFNSLPPTLHFTTANKYIRKESHQLGALFLLHCAYHTSICDLFRIGNPLLVPSLFKNRFRTSSPLDSQRWFLLHCQKTCYTHAKEVANIFGEAAQHGIKVLADTWFCTAAFESIRIILCHITQGVKRREQIDRSLAVEAIPLFRMNMKALRIMIPLIATAERCYKAANNLLKKAGFEPHHADGTLSPDDQASASELDGVSFSEITTQITPESVLLPLSIYTMARRNIDEKHTPEQIPQASTVNYITTSLEEGHRSIPAIAESNYPDLGNRYHAVPGHPNTEYMELGCNEMGEQLSTATPYSWSLEASDADINFNPFDFVSDSNGPWLSLNTVQESIAAGGSFPWLTPFWDGNNSHIPDFSQL